MYDLDGSSRCKGLVGPMDLIVRPLKIYVPKTPRGSSVHFLEGFLDTGASYTELLDQTVGQSSFVIAVIEYS